MATSKLQERGLVDRIKGPFLNISRFLREVWNELQRVVWPTHEDTYSFTVVVIISVIIVALWVGFWDLLFGNLIQWLRLY